MANCIPTADKPPRARRPIPLSLRMFAAILAMLGIACAFRVGTLYHQQCLRDRAGEELERIGAHVSWGYTGLPDWIDRWLPDDLAILFYDHEWEVHFPCLTPPLDQETTDAAMARFDGLTCIKCAWLSSTSVSDASLSHLRNLTRLRHLKLDFTHVTDAGLQELRALTNLETLDLWSTPVTDAGLEHLQGLIRLKTLYLYGTRVTDAGIGKLQRSLPAAEIHWDGMAYEK
jgi:hypothetical protein